MRMPKSYHFPEFYESFQLIIELEGVLETPEFIAASQKGGLGTPELVTGI